MVAVHHSNPRSDPCEALAPMWDARGRLRVKLVGLTLTAAMGHSPCPHPMPVIPQYHCVKCFKDIFLGRLFFKHYGIHWKSSGKNAFKTLFFKKKERLVYLLCSLFLNNLWTKEAPLIYPGGPQAAEQAPTLNATLAHCWCDCFCSHPCRQET